MWDDGKITQEQYYEACKEEITLNRPKKTKNSIVNNFVDTYTYYCATRALMEQEGFTFQNYFDSEEEKKTYNEEYDELYTSCQKKLYSGGYKIYTSIDMDKQNALQQAVDDELASYTDLDDDGTYAQSCLPESPSAGKFHQAIACVYTMFRAWIRSGYHCG